MRPAWPRVRPLKVLTSRGHQPRKRFGQHFLHDAHVIARIIDAVNPSADDHIVEIGPGRGVLTAPLVESPARISAIEIDRDLAALLRERFSASELHLIERDILRVDLAAELSADERVRIVGNLPYNISTPLIFHLFKFAPRIIDMHIMVQKEVADRMAAPAGIRDYGRLSVMTAVDVTVTRLFDVAPDSFRPPPKVQSSVLRLLPRAEPLVAPADRPVFAELVQMCFSQRRKMLRRTLGKWLSDDVIRACGLEPDMRPELVPVAAFIALARALQDARKLTHSTCG